MQAIITTLLCLGLMSSEEKATNDDQTKRNQINALDLEVNKMAQQLGTWEQQYPLVENIVENLYEHNGWNSEADIAAKEAMLRVSKIPPWDMLGRLNAVNDEIRNRYQLDDAQASKTRMLIFRSAMSMTLKYGQLGLTTAKEALETRLDGRPFSPDQIAKWVERFEPTIDTYMTDIDKIMDKMEQILTPEQRKIFELDRKSAVKRLGNIMDARHAWKRGEWTPQEWGLQDDPLHRGQRIAQSQPSSASAQTEPARMPLPAGVHPQDENTWIKYVREFIRHYELDPAQENSCISILDQQFELAAQARRHHESQQAGESPIRAQNTELQDSVKRLFGELCSRLELIPTDMQRQAASKRSADPVSEPSQRPSRSLPSHN